MKNTYICISVVKIARSISVGLFAVLPFLLAAQQSPSIQTGVTFQWSDTQDISSSQPATIQSVTINGTEYNTFVVPTSYEMTRLGPDGNNPNRIRLNGSFVVGNSGAANWNTNAITAFQDKNLNHYFTANPNGRNICLDFNATETTDAQKQTIFYNPAIPANQDGVLAVTERGGNNCFYIELWGIPPSGGPEQRLGETFVRNAGDYRDCTFDAPIAGSDYWRSGRCNDNGQAIGIGLFYLSDIAPIGSKITKIEFVGATRDHGDGKFFLLQKYAIDQQNINCIDQSYNGNLNISNNVPENSTYSLVSGPSPAGATFTFNPDGTYSYVSTPGFTGDVTFEYQVCLPEPNTNVCDQATVTISFVPQPPITETIITSCGTSSDSFTISVTNPLGPEYEYALNGGPYQSSPEFNDLPEGTYTVAVTNIFSSCETINPDSIVLDFLELNGVVTDVLCASENTGAIDITVSGGRAPYTFEWSNASTSEDLTDIAGGTYTVTVTGANGCSISEEFIVNTPSNALTSSHTASNVSCNSGNNGAIDLSVSGGTPPYTYEWNTGETTEDLDNLAAGAYSVTVTDANGCTTTQQILIEEPTAVLSANLTEVSNVDCNNNSSGIISVEALGGTAPYTYSIDAGLTFQPTGLFDNLSVGDYTILITDANDCTFNIDATIAANDTVSPEISVPSSLNLEGCSTGAINALNTVFPFSEVQSADVQSIFSTNSDYNASDDFNIASITYIDIVTSTNSCPITVSRTFTVTDSCNNTASATQIITVQDTTAPTLNVPADITIECSDDESSATTGLATGSDICGAVTISQVDAITPGSCGHTKTIVRTWTATDLCGNTTSANQVIVVEDTTPPMLTLPADVTLECNEDSSSANTGLAKGEDDCGGVRISESDVVTAGCGNTSTILRTWTVTDNCGNPTTGVQTITIQDTTPPSISVPDDVTLECNEDTSSVNTGEATGSDTCGEITISQSEVETAACGNTKTIVRTWTVTDECGNSTSADQTITVQDTTPPSIDTSALENIIIECGPSSDITLDAWLANNAGATATDACGNVSWSNDYIMESVSNCEDGALTITFTATDDCGNSASTSATYTIVDTVAPILNIPADVILECNDDTTPNNTGNASAIDECTNPSITFTDTEVAACGNTKTITRIWTATDDCGNSTSANQLITIQDTTPPTFSVPADITIECDVDVTDLSITGDVIDEADNCSSNLEASFTDSVAQGPCTNSAIISRSWSLTDDCNNTTTLVQTITVQDTTAPTFSVPQDITIECDVDFTDLSVTGDVTDEADNCSSNLEATFTDNVVVGSCPNTSIITRTWALTDDCDNTTTLTQTITVQDTTPPSFTVPADITIECDIEVTDLSITGDVTDETDNCSSNIEATFSDTIAEGTCPTLSVITRTWTLVDACNNISSAVQTITIQDTTAPIIDDSTIENIDIQCGIDGNTSFESWLNSNAGATASDNCGDVTWTNDFDANTEIDCTTGAIAVTFTATDNCGNTASTTAIYTIIDNVPPTLNIPTNVTLECGEDLSPSNTGEANATDDCSTPTISYSDTEIANCGNTITVTRTWTATDACGNTTSADQTISTQDTTPPVFTVPANITVECGVDITDLSITGDVTDETDNCSTDLQAIFTNSVEDGTCPVSSIVTRTWTLTDDCDNATIRIQTITIQDTTAPTFNETLPEDVEAECDNIPEAAILTAADNCGLADVEFSEVIATGSCVGDYIIERTWLATDSCGNETSHTQIITVQDTTAPTLVTPFDENLTVSCDGIPEKPDLVFQDSCSNNIEVAFNETNTQINELEDYDVIRIWTVTDDCGNVAEFTQTIRVEFTNLTSPFEASLCVLDGEIDLFNLLSEDFNTNGTWIVVSGEATINSSVFDPSTVDVGVYTFLYSITDAACPKEAEVTITVDDDCVVLACGEDDVVISKTVTANGDSYNEFFTITGVEDCNFTIELQIFNRWGAEIYKSSDYQNDWNGESHSSSVGNSGKVPTGTYYYIVTIKNSGLAPFTGPIYVATN